MDDGVVVPEGLAHGEGVEVDVPDDGVSVGLDPEDVGLTIAVALLVIAP